MAIEEVPGREGTAATRWRVRYWQWGRPRLSGDFTEHSEAEAFQREIRQRRRVFILRLASLGVAAAVFAIGIALFVDPYSQPVAAAFTRVGGATRVETSIEASRFWFSSRPKYVVTTSPDAKPSIMWRAAWCAVARDSPLLFMPDQGRRRQLVERTIESWPGHPTSLRVRATGTAWCAPRQVHAPSRLSTLKVASATVLPGRVTRVTSLAPVVVFAAAKTPRSTPDIVVGLALAAHLARREHVSLVVVPRYIQADHKLEDALRDHHGVADGIVLGQTGILSEDVRALLRQVITSSSGTGILGETQAALGSLEPVLAALLALLGLGAISRTATELARDRVGRAPPPRAELFVRPRVDAFMQTPIGRNVMSTVSALIKGNAPQGAANAIPTGREITVEVDGGPHAGIYIDCVALGTVHFLKLELHSREHDAGNGANGQASPAPDSARGFILVPIAAVREIRVQPAAKTNSPQSNQ